MKERDVELGEALWSGKQNVPFEEQLPAVEFDGWLALSVIGLLNGAFVEEWLNLEEVGRGYEVGEARADEALGEGVQGYLEESFAKDLRLEGRWLLNSFN